MRMIEVDNLYTPPCHCLPPALILQPFMSSSEASLIHNLTLANVTVLLLCIIASVTLAVLSRYNRSRTTQFSGPGAGWLLGCSPELAQDFSNPVKLYTGWVKQYGKIFPIPLVLGNKEFVVADVKAAAHVMAKDTVGYQTAELSRTLKTNIVRAFLRRLWKLCIYGGRLVRTRNPVSGRGGT